jgi:ATP phosphoribosyltransferase regulatory subunit
MKWLLPEYIEDILPAEAMRIERCGARLLDLFFRKKYELVMPPLLEYMDSLLTGTGHDLELRTFKVVDQLSGRMMGRARRHHAAGGAHRRPPAQPQGRDAACATAAACCTRGRRRRARRASRSRSGAEMYGEAGVAADVEMLELLCEALELAGARNVRIDIGHVAVFRAIAARSLREPGIGAVRSPAAQRTCRH